MYYLIETQYAGPNTGDDRYADADRIEISTRPALTNMSHEPRVNGWCGTTNDWAVHAHGEYESLEAARAAITAIWGEVRLVGRENDDFLSDDGSVVESYKPGKYKPLGRLATADRALESIKADIAIDTTDERIDELVTEYETEANAAGYSLHDSLHDLMYERRQELQDDMESET